MKGDESKHKAKNWRRPWTKKKWVTMQYRCEMPRKSVCALLFGKREREHAIARETERERVW